MTDKSDATLLDSIVARYKMDKKTALLVRESVGRVGLIDESATFRYEPLAEFEEKIPRLNLLKEKAVKAFRPFAERYGTSLCTAMGVPMSESLARSGKEGNHDAIYEIFGLTNAKAKRFGLAALYCAMQGMKNKVPATYNTVFDRDSPWTYRNEAEHMEEYARYHFNSYVINHIECPSENPFVPVIETYELGAADFIFMQTEQGGIKGERLATFHAVNMPGKGNVIAVHMERDCKVFYYRRWGDPYFAIIPVGEDTGLAITGIADQRFRMR